ncbi:hypothetical protein LY76DRAFT_152619 [Colletotrichum caudatum]|nr:hypothetical protein LY76DRAFT_152619 [Colletotrichum caudatum]
MKTPGAMIFFLIFLLPFFFFFFFFFACFGQTLTNASQFSGAFLDTLPSCCPCPLARPADIECGPQALRQVQERGVDSPLFTRVGTAKRPHRECCPKSAMWLLLPWFVSPLNPLPADMSA